MERTGTICRAICKHRHWNPGIGIRIGIGIGIRAGIDIAHVQRGMQN